MKLVEKFSIKYAVKCTSVTVGVCAAIIGATVFMTNLSFPENGKGGHDSRNASEIIDKELLEKSDSASISNEIEETPVESVIGNNKKSFAKSVAEASAKANLNSDFSANVENISDITLSYFSYRVKAGDIIGNIAKEYNVSTDSILSLNYINNARGLQIGQYLKIPNMSGILYTTKKSGETVSSITDKYDVDAQKFAKVNNVSLSKTFSSGSIVFIPDAKMDWATVQEINGDLFRKPIKAKWYKSSSFGWRSNPFSGVRSYHSGIDMACPQGTSIYAALSGTVTSTGFSPTYGNYVIITHHSGYKTLYGHMSAILCVKGQVVNQETRIGRVGSTGLSTGPHLHFTVYKNNAAVNPAVLWN